MVPLLSLGRAHLVLILMCLLLQAKAQDMTFTQFYFNRAMINPSYVGQRGPLTVSTIHKQQWTRLPDRTFNDMHLSALNAEISCPKYNLAMGLNMQYTEEGAGRFSQVYGAYTLSWTIKGKYSGNPVFSGFKRRRFLFSFGAQVGVGQKMLDWSRLTFSDQYDPYTSITTPSSVYTSGITETSTMEPDISFGLLYRTELPSRRSYISAGMALFHINKPKESFLYTTNRIPQRLSLHFFWHQRLKKKLHSKDPLYLNFGVISEQHMQLDGLFPPLAASMVLFNGLVLPDMAIDLGVRLNPLDGMDINSIILVYNQRVSAPFFLSFGLELNTGEFTFNQSGLSFDVGLTYTFEGTFLCKSGKKEWCFDQFTKEFIKFGPKNNMQNFVP